MRQYLIGALACMIVVFAVGATTTKDSRYAPQYPIVRLQEGQLSWASGESGALTIQIGTANKLANLLLERIDVIASNSTNAITYTIAIADENAADIVSAIALIPENDTTTLSAFETAADSADFKAIAINNILTITVTPSGVPGATGSTIDVVLYGK